LAARGHKKIWIMSNHPELFEGNPDLAQVVPYDHRFQDYASIWGGKNQHLEYAAVDLEKETSESPARHIIAELCVRAGIKGQIALRPCFYLREAERQKSAWAAGMIAIQSSGLGGIMKMQNKQWFPERFQEVVNHLKTGCKFVQLGSPNDPPLSGVVDLRGKTTIRETAAVLANCRLFVGNVGFLMHLARAVECPAVIVYGGREAPWQSGYTCNLNLYSALPCAPCWLWNRCEYGRACMGMITTDSVIRAIKQHLQKPFGNLEIEGAVI
jgi:hypothetical protein